MKMFSEENIDRKTLLSTLWIFVTLNYLYCDVFGLFDPTILNQLITGSIGGMEINEKFLLAFSLLMEIPIALVLLSRILPHRSNRVFNIVAALIKTVAMILTLMSPSTLYYWFFAIIEISTTLLIIWLAWTWSPHDAKLEAQTA